MNDWARKVERFIDAMRAGATVAGACRYASIAESDMQRMLRTGEREAQRRKAAEDRDEDPGCKTEAYRVWCLTQTSEAVVEMSALSVVRAQWEGGDGAAARWYLERRFPRDWGRARERDADHAASDANGADSSDEALQEILDELGEEGDGS